MAAPVRDTFASHASQARVAVFQTRSSSHSCPPQGKYALRILLDGEPVGASPIHITSISGKMPQTVKFLMPRVSVRPCRSSAAAHPVVLANPRAIQGVDDVLAAAQATRGLVTLEEHSVIGGLGGAISEITSEHWPTRILRIGVSDRFSQHCGTYQYLLHEHGLDDEAVANRIVEFCALLQSSTDPDTTAR